MTKMNDKELIQALKFIVIRDKLFQDKLPCLECEYEHQCSLRGCAILSRTLERLKQLTAPEYDEPLTLEELREMVGKPVWTITLGADEEYYAIVAGVDDEDVHFLSMFRKDDCGSIDLYGDTWLAYRRKPEG